MQRPERPESVTEMQVPDLDRITMSKFSKETQVEVKVSLRQKGESTVTQILKKSDQEFSFHALSEIRN